MLLRLYAQAMLAAALVAVCAGAGAGSAAQAGGSDRAQAARVCAENQREHMHGECVIKGGSYAACEDAFDAQMEAIEVAGDPAQVPLLERCCHVWKGKVNARAPFSAKRCSLMPKKKHGGGRGAAVPTQRKFVVSTRMCVGAQKRWRKGSKCGGYKKCEDGFDAELEKMEIDRPELKPMLERCCHAWKGKLDKKRPFSPRRCIDMPSAGVDHAGAAADGSTASGAAGGAGGAHSHGNPALVRSAKAKVGLLKAKLAQMLARHRECNVECRDVCEDDRNGAEATCRKQCVRKCCRKKARVTVTTTTTRKTTTTRMIRAAGHVEDVHLVHRAIVAWVTRMIRTMEDAADPRGVPGVVHAMTRVMCRKIQLKFNPTACASGQLKCGIKFRDAVGVLRFPRGPRGAASAYAQFIVGRDGKNVPWCAFEWDEREAARIARELAAKKLHDALRRRALRRARKLAAQAASAERDQEDGDLRAQTDPSEFAVLAPGAKGPDAVALRFLLRANKLFRGVAAGDYDDPAVKAVERYQQRAKLAPGDGVVTGRTWLPLLKTHVLRKWRANAPDAVKAAQYLLKFKYGRRVKVCGVYNRETAATVAVLQKQHGLPESSIVGPREWALLLADLNAVPTKMTSAQCHKRMGLRLGAERAKSGRDCLETEVFARECCAIRATFNCDKKDKEALGEMLAQCHEREVKETKRAAKRLKRVKRRALEEKEASAEEMVQRCGPCAFRTLHVGSKGPEVAALRYLLQEWEATAAHPPNKTVEAFGEGLTKDVEKFQRDKGMIPDGTVGPQTWLRLIDGEFLWRESKFDKAIRALQYVLRAKYGATRVRITGTYDRETSQAVRAFQRAEGLKEDGMVGGHTWSALMADKGSRAERRKVRREASRLQGMAHLEFVTLERGDEGASVAALKYLLKEHGLMASNDDKYDAATERVVGQYRSKAGLPADPKCDPKVWMSLISAGALVKKGVRRPDAVRAVQFVLKHRFGVALPVTGTFDAATDRAVREFQIGNMLKEDGKVGPVTWQRLLPEEEEPDTDNTPVRRSRGHAPNFSSVQTESEIQEEVHGLVTAVAGNLPPQEAAKEVCRALQNKFNSPSRAARRPGCLDGKLHCAEGFYLSIGAIKRISDLGPALQSCKHVYSSRD
jgi:peptidoglycan hydrolase-like protein with peptidoglycan-binding domain